MFGFFFHPGPVTNFEEAANNDKAKFGRWHRGMLERGGPFSGCNCGEHAFQEHLVAFSSLHDCKHIPV